MVAKRAASSVSKDPSSLSIFTLSLAIQEINTVKIVFGREKSRIFGQREHPPSGTFYQKAMGNLRLPPWGYESNASLKGGEVPRPRTSPSENLVKRMVLKSSWDG